MSVFQARHILGEVFGYSSFRQGQEEVISCILDDINVLAVMPTGSGKSLCFQIPALVKGGLTIVVSPLVALMEDQVAALKLNGVAAETINSSRGRKINIDTWRQTTSGVIRLLYISPERLMTERMLEALRPLKVSQFAIDEAHCISRWGPSFRPDYEALGQLIELFPGIPIAAFTATADKTTRLDILERLFQGQGESIITGFDRPNIHLAVKARSDWKPQLLDFVQTRSGVSGIVYCLSRKKTEATATLLVKNGIRALPYHAGLSSDQRKINQSIFMKEPGIVMTATIAFGMGIDKPDVRYVFHVNLPGNMEAYYQELGRAGRDGAPAEAIMLYGLDDIRQRRIFIEDANDDEDHKRREHKRLDALISYCETPLCRRRVLLTYFAEDTEACGNCDICIDPPNLFDGSVPAKLVLSAIKQTGERFGATHVTDVLLGADTRKIRDFGHNRLPVYGQGLDEDKNTWRSILRQLVAAGYLHLDISGYGGLNLTPYGRSFLEDGGEFRFRRDVLPMKSKIARSEGKVISKHSDLTEADADLFAALKGLRLDIANDRGVPAYVIFSDRSLVDMTLKKPANDIAFAGIFGVGKAKLRDFCMPFLAVIAEFK